jgi:outer membrane protein, heavy metal efflux system
MKYTVYFTLLVVICVSGCAQNRNETRAVSQVDVHRVEKSAFADTATTASGESSSSDAESVPALVTPPQSVVDSTAQKSSGWQSTASLDAAKNRESQPDIRQVGHRELAPAVDDAEISTNAPRHSAPSPTTLDSLEQLALASNPTLSELQANIDAANGRWLQVGLKPNPVAAFSVQEIGNEGSAGQYGAQIGQQFVMANKLELNRNSAAWRVKQVEQQLAAQRLRVLTDVRRSFYAVLVAQERIVVANELRVIAQQSVEKAKELIKFQEPATVLTQAEIEAELAAVLVDNFTTQQEFHWRRLATVIGVPDLPLQRVAGQLSTDAPKVVWEQAVERVRRESPEIAAAAAEVERSRWALQRADVESTPNVTLQTGVFYDDSSNDPFAMFQMSMPLPINDWNQGGIAEAQANVIVAEQSVQRVELSLQQRLASVYQQYEQARKQSLRYETTILQKARKNLDLNRQSYDSGQSSYLAVLTAQRSYSQARLAWLNALDQLWSATVQIEGLLLSDSLE